MLKYALALALPLLAGTQATVLQIRVVEGEGAVQACGSRASGPLAVLVTDEVGRPIEDAAVSFRLPEEGPGGIFTSGLKTDVAKTRPDGSARAGDIRWNRTPGPVRIRITAVKDGARAGTAISQYLAAGGRSRSASRRRNRWFAVAAVAAGAVAAGYAAGQRGEPAASAPSLRVGPPAISIGRP